MQSQMKGELVQCPPTTDKNGPKFGSKWPSFRPNMVQSLTKDGSVFACEEEKNGFRLKMVQFLPQYGPERLRQLANFLAPHATKNKEF